MTRYLLDVNVLLAIVWPLHGSHAAALSWFARTGHQAWASNPVTQLGVLRLLTNPAATQGAISAESAVSALIEATRHPGHEFWALDADVASALKPIAARLRGYQQWTDALILWHAAQRDGVLVTFDSGLKQLAVGELSGHLLVLKSHL